MTSEELVDSYLDGCEAESWEGRAMLNGDRIFPFQRPVAELVAPLYELCDQDLDVMMGAIDSWATRRTDSPAPDGPLNEDVDRGEHLSMFPVVLYDCIGNLFGRIPRDDDRYVEEYVEAGHARGWNDGANLGKRRRFKRRPSR